MGIMVYSLLWVMQDLYHQPDSDFEGKVPLKIPTTDVGSRNSNSASKEKQCPFNSEYTSSQKSCVTTIMESGPNYNRPPLSWIRGPNSIIIWTSR